MGKKKKEVVQYSRNDDYSQEEVTMLIRIYHLALDVDDQVTAQEILNRVYALTEKFVYKTLWTSYKTLMQNRTHRDDITQEVWARIFTEIKTYDPERAAITTFMVPWIRHVVSDYTSRNFRKTSVYYANSMTKVSGAQNYARQYGLDPDDLETLVNLTGLSPATVKNSLELLARKDVVSYEALTEVGVDCTSRIKGPEEMFMEDESEKALRNVLNDVLDDEEKRLLELLLTPENPRKNHSSYREIMEQIPGSNVPKIKRKISKMITKLKNNRRFAEMYPYIIAQDRTLETGYVPVIDDDDDMGEIDREYAAFDAGEEDDF